MREDMTVTDFELYSQKIEREVRCIQRKTDQKLALCSDFHLTGIEFFWVLSGISQFNSQ